MERFDLNECKTKLVSIPGHRQSRVDPNTTSIIQTSACPPICSFFINKSSLTQVLANMDRQKKTQDNRNAYESMPHTWILE